MLTFSGAVAALPYFTLIVFNILPSESLKLTVNSLANNSLLHTFNLNSQYLVLSVFNTPFIVMVPRDFRVIVPYSLMVATFSSELLQS